MAAVLDYLDRVDPAAAAEARERYACLTPWSARAGRLWPGGARPRATRSASGRCSSILRDLIRKAADYAAQDGETFFDAAQNARLVADAERYYRAMYYGAHESWNLRDRHMFETLEQILALRGPKREGGGLGAQLPHRRRPLHRHGRGAGRAEHRPAVPRALRPGRRPDRLRHPHRHGDGRLRLGCAGGGQGRAARRGPTATRRCATTPAWSGSCSTCGPAATRPLREDLREPRLERYIGVIYRPETERVSHYALASLPDQYDGVRLVRRDQRGDAPADGGPAGRGRDLSVRPLSGRLGVRHHLQRRHQAGRIDADRVDAPADQGRGDLADSWPAPRRRCRHGGRCAWPR